MIPRLGLALLTLVTVIGAGLTGYLINAGPVGAALIAKQVCSLTFLSGLEPDRARTLYLESLLGPGNRFFEQRVDRARKRVVVRGTGTEATAGYYPGLGCVLGPAPADLQQTVTATQPPPVGINHRIRQQSFDQQALEAALDRAFTETAASGGRRNTLAIAIRYGDSIVGERYAPGVTAATPLPGWSMAKSVTATLAGQLVLDGLLNLQATELFPEWQAPDPRATITPEQLLRMLSGIDLEENGSGLDPNSRMLFLEPDALRYAVNRGLRATPGEAFAYTSGSTILLQGYLTQLVGGQALMQQRVRRLFDTLGMHSAVLEPDPAGTFAGSSFLFASARDWTRLGQLYLNEGRWQGEQMFDPAWASYVAQPTPASGDRAYTAGFWGPRREAVYRDHGVPAPPADTLVAHGLQNQALYIIPSAGLVIARLGATGRYWHSGEWDLVADVLAARVAATGGGTGAGGPPAIDDDGTSSL